MLGYITAKPLRFSGFENELTAKEEELRRSRCQSQENISKP
jgi:hypothetical protein